MKKALLLAGSTALCALVIAVASLIFRFPASAEPPPAGWEYASITGPYGAVPVENPNFSFTAALNICYLQSSGCRSEEVAATVLYARFLQDNRLENNPRSMELARHRAIDNVYSRAIAKLGAEGWEMISKPELQFDTFYQNASGTFDVAPGNYHHVAKTVGGQLELFGGVPPVYFGHTGKIVQEMENVKFAASADFRRQMNNSKRTERAVMDNIGICDGQDNTKARSVFFRQFAFKIDDVW